MCFIYQGVQTLADKQGHDIALIKIILSVINVKQTRAANQENKTVLKKCHIEEMTVEEMTVSYYAGNF